MQQEQHPLCLACWRIVIGLETSRCVKIGHPSPKTETLLQPLRNEKESTTSTMQRLKYPSLTLSPLLRRGEREPNAASVVPARCAAIAAGKIRLRPPG
jgi:hypothetical protein